MIRKNIFSILVSVLLLYLSLTSSKTFENLQLGNIPHIDKVVHFGMYFILMSVIIIEHRKTLRNPIYLFGLALFPLGYGILMEILQMTLTSSRTGDFYDAIADAAGILAAVIIWLLVKPLLKLPAK